MTSLLLRFSANPWPFSVAIRMRTWSKYSHVDFVLEDGKFMGALPFGGVQIHEHRYPVEAYFKIEMPQEKVDAILEAAKALLGTPYDFWGIFGYAFIRDWQEPDKFFCSEYVAAMIQPHFNLYNETPSKITPRDLSIHGALELLQIH